MKNHGTHGRVGSDDRAAESLRQTQGVSRSAATTIRKYAETPNTPAPAVRRARLAAVPRVSSPPQAEPTSARSVFPTAADGERDHGGEARRAED